MHVRMSLFGCAWCSGAKKQNKNRLLYPFAWRGSHVIAWLLTCCQISSQNPLPLLTVMAFYMYPKHADMSMHSNLKTARNSLLLKLSNHTKGTTNFAKNKVGRYTLWILRELGAEPTDIPELFPGDKHLGQTLQLGSLLLHGVPDAVHLSAETRSKGQGGLCFYASKCASLLFRWQTHKESPDWTKAWRRSVRWWQTMHWHLGFCLPFKHHGERWG